MSKQMIMDIERHFHAKLRRLLIDAAQICEIAEIDNDDMIGMVIPSLIYELSTAALALEMTEPQFLQMCLVAFRKADEHIQEAYAMAAQRHH